VTPIRDLSAAKALLRVSRTWKLVLLVLGFVTLVLLGSISLGRLGDDRMLERLLGAPLASGQKIVQSGNERGVLFGDSAFAWKVASSSSRISLPTDYQESDDSDLRFAIQEIESLLQTRVARPPDRRVFRGGRGGINVYCVTESSGLEVFVFAIRN
jgi:hypothetical protein